MLIFNVSLLYFVVTMPILFAISDEVVIFNEEFYLFPLKTVFSTLQYAFV